jgi:hypothetical protein
MPGLVTPKLLTISPHARLDPPPLLSDGGTGSQTQRNVSVTAKPHATAALSDSQRFIRIPALHVSSTARANRYVIVGKDIAAVQMRQVIRNSRHLCKNIKLFQRFPRLLH